MRYLLFLVLILLPSDVFAQEMFSPSYRLELEQIEATTEARTERLNTLQLKEFFENGYIVESSDKNSLHFSISDTVLSFTDLQPEKAQSHSVLSTVTSPELYGYQLIAVPLQGFETANGDQIPATQCDGKEQTCTVRTAKQWRLNTMYGWGYTVSGPDANRDFLDESFYRPFKTGESVVIANNPSVSSQRATKLTIKTITSPETPEGNYRSVIKLIALPTF